MMKNNNFWFTFILLTVISIFLIGCNSTEDVGTNNEVDDSTSEDVEKQLDAEDIRIGATVITAQHAFYVDVINGMEDKANEAGVGIQVVDPDHDLARQTKQIKDFIQQKIDALIVYGVDPEAVVPPVEEAIEAGIPVVTADMKLNSDKVSTFIGTDNRAAGKIAGDFVAEYVEDNLDGEAKVGIIVWESSITQRDRAAGFIEGIEALPGIEVIGEFPGNDRATSLSSAQSMLQSHPDLDFIFATNEGGALGAMNALEIADNSGVELIGFDITAELTDAIIDGKVLATVAQLPRLIGETTVESVLEILDGKEIDEIIDIPAELVTEENAENFR